MSTESVEITLLKLLKIDGYEYEPGTELPVRPQLAVSLCEEKEWRDPVAEFKTEDDRKAAYAALNGEEPADGAENEADAPEQGKNEADQGEAAESDVDDEADSGEKGSDSAEDQSSDAPTYDELAEMLKPDLVALAESEGVEPETGDNKGDYFDALVEHFGLEA